MLGKIIRFFDNFENCAIFKNRFLNLMEFFAKNWPEIEKNYEIGCSTPPEASEFIKKETKNQ